jgi:hypothetical protein
LLVGGQKFVTPIDLLHEFNHIGEIGKIMAVNEAFGIEEAANIWVSPVYRDTPGHKGVKDLLRSVIRSALILERNCKFVLLQERRFFIGGASGTVAARVCVERRLIIEHLSGTIHTFVCRQALAKFDSLFGLSVTVNEIAELRLRASPQSLKFCAKFVRADLFEETVFDEVGEVLIIRAAALKPKAVIAKLRVRGAVLVTIGDFMALVIEVFDSVSTKYQQFGI